jgi:type II secretory pathway pseudopilin PulG
MNLLKNRKRKNGRKGFSLVELVGVILSIAILAVAVFAGGSAVIKRAQVSRTVSDLHNFSVAIEAAMNETPTVANMSKESDFTAIVDAVKKNLPTEYALSAKAETATTGNTILTQGTAGTGTYVIYQSDKSDAWGNPYYVIFDCTERHDAGISEFYITVVSAGPNAQTTISNTRVDKTKGIEADDVFLLVQYTDGNVVATTYNMASDSLVNGAGTTLGKTEKGVAKAGIGSSVNESETETAPTKDMQAHYIGTLADKSGLTSMCPVNFQVS